MYSRARYSLIRYSLGEESRVIEAGEDFASALGGLAGGAVPIDAGEFFSETVLGAARGTISVPADFAADAELLGSARLSADVAAGTSFAAALDGTAYAQKDMPAGMELLEVLGGSVCAGKNVPAPVELMERLEGSAAGSKDILGGMAAWETLTTMAEATSQTTERASFQLVIPPGGELRIDSELFTVLLNGENALHTQSGDWISISRELLRIIVESASGGELEGQLIYQERYL